MRMILIQLLIGAKSFKDGFICFDNEELQSKMLYIADLEKEKKDRESLLYRLSMELSILQ